MRFRAPGDVRSWMMADRLRLTQLAVGLVAGIVMLTSAFAGPPEPEKITLPPGPNAAFLSRIPTTQKVAFITMDDGWSKSTQGIELVKAAHVPVTLFLTMNAIRNNPGYFKQLEASGAVIEAHTI